jgi:hypothetical protein
VSTDSPLWCASCNASIGQCTCPDRDASLKEASNSGYVAFKWCRVCDKHYARCNCQDPDFYVRCGGQEVPQPPGGFTMADGSRRIVDPKVR